MYSFAKIIVLLLPALFASWNSTVLAMSPATLSISQNSNGIKNLRQGLQDTLIERTPSSLESKNKLMKPQVLKYMVAVVLMVTVAYFVIRCVRSFSKTKSLRRLAGADDEECGGAVGGDSDGDDSASDGGSYTHTSEGDTDEDRAFEKKEHACREMEERLNIMKGNLDKCYAFEMEYKSSRLEHEKNESTGEDLERIELLQIAIKEAWIKLMKKEMEEYEEEEKQEALKQIEELEKDLIGKTIPDEKRAEWIAHQTELIEQAEIELEEMRQEMKKAYDERLRQERREKREAGEEEIEELGEAMERVLGDGEADGEIDQ